MISLFGTEKLDVWEMGKEAVEVGVGVGVEVEEGRRGSGLVNDVGGAVGLLKELGLLREDVEEEERVGRREEGREDEKKKRQVVVEKVVLGEQQQQLFKIPTPIGS